VVLTLALIVFGIAYYGGSRYSDRSRPAPLITGVAIHPPSPLPSLPDAANAPLRHETLVDRWSLLMLDSHAGETHAPALLRLLQIHNRLAAAPELQHRLHYLYLPRSLEQATQQAVDGLSDQVHALAGNPQLVDETFRSFGLEPEESASALYLIGPQARLHALFTPDQDIATIVEDLTLLIPMEP
jgi:hypothetical protein